MTNVCVILLSNYTIFNCICSKLPLHIYLCWKEPRELHTACQWLRTLCSLKYRACSSHCWRHRASCSRCRASCSASIRDRLGRWTEHVGRAISLNKQNKQLEELAHNWRKPYVSVYFSVNATRKKDTLHDVNSFYDTSTAVLGLV